MGNIALKEKVYQQLRSSILSGDFAPGDLLNRRGLAKEYGTSPAPVHEAMIQLQCEGFLETLPRRGTRVKTASRENVRGHMIVREAFECQAARLICGDVVKNNMDSLKALALETDEGCVSDLERADREVNFHVGLVETAGCEALTREYRKVMQIGLFYRINLIMSIPHIQPVKRHILLLEELAAKSPQEAEDSMREHIWSGKPDAIRY